MDHVSKTPVSVVLLRMCGKELLLVILLVTVWVSLLRAAQPVAFVKWHGDEVLSDILFKRERERVMESRIGEEG